MTTTFTHKTFEQWKSDNPDIIEISGECLECDGDGEHLCSCGDMHECGFCDGTGKTLEGRSLTEMYNEQLKRDKARLEKWVTS